MTELLSDPEAWVAFFTLTALELVLGIDNIIFISILVDKCPKARQEFTRRFGLFLAMFMRVGLLFLLTWMVGLTKPLFDFWKYTISGRDLILIAGGMFLLWKATREVHHLLEGDEPDAAVPRGSSFAQIVLQIVLIDIVFSLDSIITAVGMVRELPVMIAAVIASVGLMMLFAAPIGKFVSSHPTVKMLALSFLFVIGLVLVADGLGHHIPKGYIYFAMAFSVLVELLNLRIRRSRRKPIQLRKGYRGRKV